MKSSKSIVRMVAAVAAVGLFAAGCGSDDAEPDLTASESTSQSSESTSTSSEESSSESSEPEAPPQIRDVDEAAYTPADGPQTRIFQLQDGATRCFLNNLAGDVFLACETNLAEPPEVQDGFGNPVPANAVSWNPDGVTFARLMFPPVAEVATLNPQERLSAFGFSCTAYGPATVECSGQPGTATIDSGQVIGASVPPPSPVPAEPGPEQPQPGPPPVGVPGLDLLLPPR